MALIPLDDSVSASLSPELPDTNRMRCFRLNVTQLGSLPVEVWTTRYPPDSNSPLPLDEVVMLKADSVNRLLPLCRQLTDARPVFTGLSEDQGDPHWWHSLKRHPNLDAAIEDLRQTGVNIEIIDYLFYQPVSKSKGPRLPKEDFLSFQKENQKEEDTVTERVPRERQVSVEEKPSPIGLLSIGFMQLVPYLSGQRRLYREISLDDVVQVVYCWL